MSVPCALRHAEERGTETSVARGFETKISPKESVCLLLPLRQ